jgi:hypothetical protein
VLRATSELLAEVGLRAMTTEEIAGRSGASKAMPLAGMALPVVSAKRVYINDGGVASDQRLSVISASGSIPGSSTRRAAEMRPFLLGRRYKSR